MPKPDYDTTIARIAGNIASGMLPRTLFETGGRIENVNEMAAVFVMFARAIVAEVRRTEPEERTREWINRSQIKGGAAIAEKIENLENIQYKCESSRAGNRLETEG